MKKTIKIKLVGWWKNFDPDTHILTQCLKKKYNVEFVDKNPEYIIFRYDTAASETATTEGYEHIKEFESYGVKQYAVLKRIEP